MSVYADLHVHIGQANNRFVKITASRSLTISNALKYAKVIKGIDVLGLVDSGSKAVLLELEELLDIGELTEIKEGGLKTKNGLLLILGWELEVKEVHYLLYLPYLKTIKELTKILWPRTKNQELSTQRYLIPPAKLRLIIEDLGGLFLPAHAFTPHKGFYGKAYNSFKEEFDQPFQALELGLSSCTEMVSGICELQETVFLANSDAHSLPKIAREYNEMLLSALNFEALKEAVEKEQIIANYGLDPRLGKYHETACLKCGKSLELKARCGCGGYAIKGVRPRCEELGGLLPGRKRPPYIKQIPLEFLPGIGSKTISKLLEVGTELDILNKTSIEEIKKATNEKIAGVIKDARDGNLTITAGGAGYYGKVKVE